MMIHLTFPDRSVREFPAGIMGLDVAKQISISLSKKAFVMQVNGALQDLSAPLFEDAVLEFLTIEDPRSISVIRHDAAHITAQAVKELFPDVQVTIGPAIENGFYYDFAKDQPFTTDDLAKIEHKMREIVAKDQSIERQVWDRNDAIEFFKSNGEYYKAEIIESIPALEKITLYKQGTFIDLCRGPHGPSTGRIKHFKLTKISGAYWRGNSNNPMLQRIYGTSFATKEELDQHLFAIEEAEKRDHRKIGKELQLFHLQEEAKGMVFWHHKGWSIYRVVENYIRNKIQKNGYIEVRTPVLLDKALWEASGHWEKFSDNMFALNAHEEVLALKPMNCPAHVQIFKQGTKSYRELPIRMSEFGLCHRNESTGGLHGLMRVRNFTQDDAHIFCTADQVITETISFYKLLVEVYQDFGFHEIKVKFSDRPVVRAGTDAVWDKAENALIQATKAAGFDYTLNPGDGAFYGPKLEFHLKDALGREWQCGTLQVDFVLPERLGAFYVAQDGDKRHPVILHRAILGTFERFIGILIENCGGKFDIWLAPVQVAIATITNDVDDFAKSLYNKLLNCNVRCELDISSQKIGYKISAFSRQKIPLIAVIGHNEAKNNTVSVRRFGSLESVCMSIEDLTNFVQQENAKYF